MLVYSKSIAAQGLKVKDERTIWGVLASKAFSSGHLRAVREQQLRADFRRHHSRMIAGFGIHSRYHTFTHDTLACLGTLVPWSCRLNSLLLLKCPSRGKCPFPSLSMRASESAWDLNSTDRNRNCEKDLSRSRRYIHLSLWTC
jgi:hypothetical protein